MTSSLSLPHSLFYYPWSSRILISIFRTPVLHHAPLLISPRPPSFVWHRQQHVFRELRPNTSMSEMLGTVLKAIHRRYHLYTLVQLRLRFNLKIKHPFQNALYWRSKPSMHPASQSHPPNTPAPYQIPTFLPRISNTPLHHHHTPCLRPTRHHQGA